MEKEINKILEQYERNGHYPEMKKQLLSLLNSTRPTDEILEEMALKEFPVDFCPKDIGGAMYDSNKRDRAIYRMGLRKIRDTYYLAKVSEEEIRRLALDQYPNECAYNIKSYREGFKKGAITINNILSTTLTNSVGKSEAVESIQKSLSEISDDDAIMCYIITDPRGKQTDFSKYFIHRHKKSTKDSTLVSIDIRRQDAPDDCLNIGYDWTMARYSDEKTPTLERIENQILAYEYLKSKGYKTPDNSPQNSYNSK